MRNRRFRMFLAVALLLGACSAMAETAADKVVVSDLQVREVLPGQSNTASFMILGNTGDRDHSLHGAESPEAQAVELHTHRMQDGMMRMRPVDQVPLPPGETVRFEPGGLHLMWIGLAKSLKAGQEVPLTLVFEDGSRLELMVPVRAMRMPGSQPHRHQGM